MYYSEFLTGFRKRKNERRKKAHEDMIEKYKEEKRRIKKEASLIFDMKITKLFQK